MNETLTAKDFASSQEVRWCPGCGDYAILKAITKALADVGAQPESTVFVDELGPSWIEVNVWPWARIGDWWELHCRLPQDLLELLTEAGIRMPYTRHEITMLGERPETPGGSSG